MSAAAQLSPVPARVPHFDEAGTLLAVSRLANKESDPNILLDAVMDRLISVPGVQRVCISLEGHARWQGRERSRRALGPQGMVLAKIETAGRSWGVLRIYISLTPVLLPSPVRFAMFVSQQLAGALSRIDLTVAAERRRRSLSALKTRLVRRKLVYRVAGKMSDIGGISQSEAVGYLIAQSRRHRQSLLQVSRLVLSFMEARVCTEHNHSDQSAVI